jgi:phosphohistidine phosphatase SixA
MALYLVRHAKAGQRGRWDGPDHLRPLTKAGRAQAEALAAWLANYPVPQILSSPFVRCVQTVEALAAKLDLTIETVEFLSEAVPFEPALERLPSLPDHAVLCTHGDLLPDLIEALVRRGTVIDGAMDWRKGTTWVLTREDGVVVRAHAVPPPDDIDQG